MSYLSNLLDKSNKKVATAGLIYLIYQINLSFFLPLLYKKEKRPSVLVLIKKKA